MANMTLGSGLREKPPGNRAMRTMVHLRWVANNLSRPAPCSVGRAGCDDVSSHVSGMKRAPPFATGLNQRGIPAARGGLKDQRRLVMAALEVVLGPTLQPLDKGVQDHEPPPVRGRQSRPVCLTSRERQNLATGPWRTETRKPRLRGERAGSVSLSTAPATGLG